MVDYRLDGELTPEQTRELRRPEALGDAGINSGAIPSAPAGGLDVRRGPVTPG